MNNEEFAIKESLELAAFMGKLVNAPFSALADGQINFEDLSVLLPVIFAAQPAIKDIAKIGDEQHDATIDERDDLEREFAQMLMNVDPEIADDLTRTFGGIFAMYRIGLKIGRKRGEESIIEKIKSGAINVADLVDQE